MKFDWEFWTCIVADVCLFVGLWLIHPALAFLSLAVLLHFAEHVKDKLAIVIKPQNEDTE
jgi:uncharacterized membrane protein